MYTLIETRSGDMVERVKTVKMSRPQLRGEKRNITPPDMVKRNALLKQRKLTRDLAANFKNGDRLYTLSFRQNPDGKELSKIAARFFRRIKRTHPEAAIYIKVTEKGEKLGKYHFHIVMKREVSLEAIEKAWEYGSVNVKIIYSAPDFRRLAEYLLKMHRPPGQKAWVSGRANKKPVEKRSKLNRKSFVKVPAGSIKIRDKTYKLEDWEEHADPFTMERVQYAIYFLRREGQDEHS